MVHGQEETYDVHVNIADPETNLLHGFDQLLMALRNLKPDERNEKARRYAVTITELEKVQAYFEVYIYAPRKVE